MDGTTELIELDRRYIVHPLHHPDDHKNPLVIVEGRGAMLRDAEGREFIDGLAGLWNVNIGHGRAELAEAAAAQMKKIAFASAYIGATNEPAIRLGEKIVRHAYSNSAAVYYTTAGADNARFGQPEISLGTIPGAGGTQRLPRFVGKSKAMDLVLTGRMMDAAEAERCGLVSRVVPLGQLMDDAIATAEKIAGMSLPATMVAKEAVNRAFETTLAEGVRFERRTFHATFAFEDRAEGMSAFADKRKPAWKHR